MDLLNLKPIMYHCFQKNNSQWMKSVGSVYISKDGRYNKRTKILSKVGWTFNLATNFCKKKFQKLWDLY